MMRSLAFLFVPLLAAGCALPPALTIASFAADGISYIATGKSTTDHALSAIASEDCALLRAVQEQPICVAKRQVQLSMSEAKPSTGADSGPEDSDLRGQD
jgi:hypothetical protein